MRRSLKRELEEILELKRIISKSKLTEEDVEELSDKINESLAKRFREFSTAELLELPGFFI